MVAYDRCSYAEWQDECNDSRSHLRLVYARQAAPTKRPHKRSACGRAQSLAPLVCMVCVALVVCMVSAVVDGVRTQKVAGRIERARTEVVRVVEGDTLWSIATRHEIEGVSTQDVVSWVRCKNGLETSELTAGQELVVPCGYSE